MNIDEAAKILRSAYRRAPERRQMTALHLFGIKYADELASMPLKQLVEMAGIPPSYHVELNNGRNLAEYVNLKDVPLWFGND